MWPFDYFRSGGECSSDTEPEPEEPDPYPDWPYSEGRPNRSVGCQVCGRSAALITSAGPQEPYLSTVFSLYHIGAEEFVFDVTCEECGWSDRRRIETVAVEGDT